MAICGSYRLARWLGLRGAAVAFISIALLLAASELAVAQPMANSPESARILLTSRYELTPVDGNRWLVAEEVRLREALAGLGEKLAAFDVAEQAMQAALNANRQAWERRRSLEQSLNVALSNGNAQQSAQLQAELQALPEAADPEQPGENARVLAAVAGLMSARQSALAAVLEVRQLHEQLPELYAPLAGSEELAAELARLGPRHRLGPAGRYEREFRAQRLGEYESRLLTDTVPVAPLGHWWRVGGLLNDRTPLTFVLDEHSEITWITSNDLQRAGLEVSPNAVPGTLTITPSDPTRKERTLEVTRIELPTLRFGAYELSGVQAFVLPPEGEDLGTHLSTQAFNSRGYTLELERTNLRMVITPAE